MAKRKDFSGEMYLKYDGVAKRKAIDFFSQFNYELCDQSGILREHYNKGDLVIQHKVMRNPFAIEVEVKNPWKVSGYWQPNFDTVDFLESKINTKAQFWVLFNRAKDTLLVANLDDIRKSPHDTKDAKIEDGTKMENEEYRKIPIDKCKFYRQTDQGRWEPIDAYG